MGDLTLEQIDADGALDEALHGLFGRSRAAFLRSAAFGGGAALVAALAPIARGAEPDPDDFDVLNFDLTFEHLQAGFYDEALRFGALGKETTRWARVIGAHERAHVKILSEVLGRQAVKKPFFDYQGVTEDEDAFTRTAVAMEDLTTDLLIGQLHKVRTPALVSALFSFLSVEARHAAWVRHVVGVLPIARPLDEAKSLKEVAEVIESTQFMKEDPITWAKTAPRFTG
jgi:Ferritin-like domain